MEGRTIVRPDLSMTVVTPLASDPPSMEGRTIVRPDLKFRAISRSVSSSFNGGPDNRPARPAQQSGTDIGTLDLQWRAGQSSGQTAGGRQCRRGGQAPSMEGRTIVRPDQGPENVGGVIVMPSMEGRTIVRPDPIRTRPASCVRITFNGGPDNRPARPGAGGLNAHRTLDLQWRAGQSSGQTSICRADSPERHDPSMQGRTIVRPD